MITAREAQVLTELGSLGETSTQRLHLPYASCGLTLEAGEVDWGLQHATGAGPCGVGPVKAAFQVSEAPLQL
jgi:hypothetical protein